MPVELLPQQASGESDSESRDSAEDSRRGDDSEEVPETANEGAALELRREQPPREWRGPDEPGKESDVCGEVFDRRTPKVVKL